MDRLGEAGYSVPGDISIVGYDNTSLAQLRQVSLTTVNQPREAMGRVAMQTVLERIEGGRTEAVSHVTAPHLGCPALFRARACIVNVKGD